MEGGGEGRRLVRGGGEGRMGDRRGGREVREGRIKGGADGMRRVTMRTCTAHI